jgi:hypothetical protein
MILAFDAEEPGSIPTCSRLFCRKGGAAKQQLSVMGGVRKHAVLHFLSLERRVHAVRGPTRTDNRERKGGREE